VLRQVLYDDMYDEDYQETELESGKCLGPDVCGDDAKQGSSSTPSPSSQPPNPAEPRNLRKLLRANDADTAAEAAGISSSKFAQVAEVNAKDSADGKGYDPEFGEGPYGETLCDAPPHKSFNYYGYVVLP
jgi:hypothetical protein